MRRWLRSHRQQSDLRHGEGVHPARTPAARHGSHGLAERASLRVDPVVTDALIDDLLPTVEYIELLGSTLIGNDSRQPPEPEAHQRADTVRAFRALLEDPTRTGYTYFVRRWVERGMPRRDAERRFVHLLTDLTDLESEVRSRARGVEPRRGDKAAVQVDHLVRGAAVSWYKHTGQPADTSESAAFVKFCLALASLAELPLDPDVIRRVLDQRG